MGTFILLERCWEAFAEKMKVLLVFVSFVAYVAGHGYMKDPAARNCMWRFGFKNPKNWDDTGLYCGSFGTQWDTNKGACGICGDAANSKHQAHMDGGKYANGLIARMYNKGQVIPITIFLETTHHGWWEFRIGAFNEKRTAGDKMGHLAGPLMEFTDGPAKGTTRFHKVGKDGRDYHHNLQLPADMTCTRCVIQWWWKAANSWGCDKDGCGMGHGPQETFVNCADVAITE